MWWFGTVMLSLGVALAALGVLTGDASREARARWSLTRGAAVAALGSALLFLAALVEPEALSPAAFTTLGASSSFLELLSAATVFVFGTAAATRPVEHPKSRPSARRASRLQQMEEQRPSARRRPADVAR